MSTLFDRLLNLAKYSKQTIQDIPDNTQRVKEAVRTVFSNEPNKVQQRHQFYETNIREPVFQKLDKTGKAAPLLKFLATQSLGERGSPPVDVSSPEFQEKALNIALGMSDPLRAVGVGKYLKGINPEGLINETLAQTRFRQATRLHPADVYQEFNVPAYIAPNRRVGIFDYISTPENVLRKIGLDDEMKTLRSAREAVHKDLPLEIAKIAQWQKRVPNQESNVRIFRYLDGKEVNLNPIEQGVASEIQDYLKGWATKLRLPKDKQISSYITHIFEKDAGLEFDAEVAKLIKGKVAKSIYDPFLKKRIGMPDYIEDTWRSLEAYTKRGVRKYHQDPALEAVERASRKLDIESYGYVERYISRVNMRPTEVDSLVDNAIKSSRIGYKFGTRPTANITGKARQMVYRATLGLNPGSALKNLTQISNTYSQVGEKNLALGLFDFFKGAARRNLDELYESGVLQENIVQDRQLHVVKGALEKADPVLFGLFDQAEKFNRGVAYFAAKRQGLAKGLGVGEAMEFAKDVVRKTQFSYDAIDTPVAMGSDWIKTIFQFSTYPLKQSEFLINMAESKQWGGMLRWLGSSYLLAATYGKLFGMDFKDFFPFLDIASGQSKFQPPIVDVAKSGIELSKTAIDRDLSDNQKAREILSEGLKLGSLTIPGGTQIKKSVQGLQSYVKGKSETPSGRIRFRVPQTPENLIRSTIFGQFSLPQARKYFAEGAMSKSEFEYEGYKELLTKDPEAAHKLAEKIKADNPIVYSEMKWLKTADRLQATEQERKLHSINSIETRAEKVASELGKYEKGSSERKELVARWRELRIITDSVYKQLLKLQKESNL